MAGPGPPNASGLSYCSVDPRGFLFEGGITDQLLSRLERIPIGTQCLKFGNVTTEATPSLIESGGTIPSGAFGVTAGSAVTLSRAAWKLVLPGDVAQGGAVGEITDIRATLASLMAAEIGKLIGQAIMAPAPLPNGPDTIPTAAAANPNGIHDIAGDRLQRRDLFCLATRTPPLTSRSAFVMRPSLFYDFAARELERGTPVPYLDQGEGLLPYIGPYPILLDDNIQPGAGVESVYFVRLGLSPEDPVGLAPAALVFPEGYPGIQVSPFEPSADGSDTLECTVFADFGFHRGSAMSVAGINGAKS